jgi:hypothetical protein
VLILFLENMETNQREEDLTHMWGKFSLMEEENSNVSLETSEIESLVSRGKFCLIGKLLAERVVTKEFFKALLPRAWRPTGEVFFLVVGDNMFVAEFEMSRISPELWKADPGCLTEIWSHWLSSMG